MYFDFTKKSCVEIAKEKMDSLGIKLEDLRENGLRLFQEIYHNEIGDKIIIEIYEIDNRLYLVRCVDDNKCVEFRNIK